MRSTKYICDCCGKEIPKQWSDWCDSKYLEKETILEEYSWYVVQKRSLLTTGDTHTDVVDLCVKCHEKYIDLAKEQAAGRMIRILAGERMIASDIVEVYKNMMERQDYESRWITPDGLEHITDTGYAADGAFFFLQELLTELNAVDLLKEVEEEE